MLAAQWGDGDNSALMTNLHLKYMLYLIRCHFHLILTPNVRNNIQANHLRSLFDNLRIIQVEGKDLRIAALEAQVLDFKMLSDLFQKSQQADNFFQKYRNFSAFQTNR